MFCTLSNPNYDYNKAVITYT